MWKALLSCASVLSLAYLGIFWLGGYQSGSSDSGLDTEQTVSEVEDVGSAGWIVSDTHLLSRGTKRKRNVTCSRSETKFLNNFSPRPRIGFISYPRSGNSMTRGLIEQLTGVWTGSYQFAVKLKDFGFLGDGYIDDSVHVIKEHATGQESLKILKERNFSKIIYLYRNPFDVFLSYINRIASGHTHNETVEFHQESFLNNLTEWIPDWRLHVNTFALNLTNSTYLFLDGRYLPVLLVRYEDLTNSTSRPHQLQRLAKFLELPHTERPRPVEKLLVPKKKKRLSEVSVKQLYKRSPADFITVSPPITQERIDCVHQATELVYVPRKKKTRYGVDTYAPKLRNLVLSSLTKELCLLGYAFLSPTITLQCDKSAIEKK